MRLLTCTVENFGSYQHLEIDFANVGLGLIYGRTGSGKSTIPDMACWVLYGQTAKDGAVDEVRSWQSPGEPTSGILTVELPNGKITVTRVRGKQTQNDLFWIEETSPDILQRGKDINDTQRKLNQRLGVDSDLYLSGSYFHEFSPSGSFFTAKAKDRRELFERIADLSLPIKLANSASEARKGAKLGHSTAVSEFDRLCGVLQALRGSLESSKRSSESWDKEQAQLIKTLGQKFEAFHLEKGAKVAALEAKAKGFEQEKHTKILALKDKIAVFDLTKTQELLAVQSKYTEFDADKDAKLDLWTKELQALNSRLPHEVDFAGQIADLKGSLQKLGKEKCGACGGPKSSDKCGAIRDDIAAVEKAQYENKSLVQTFDALADKIEALQATANPYLSQAAAIQAKTHSYAEQIAQIQHQENPYPPQVEQATKAVNPYMAQMEAETEKQNPFKASLERIAAEIVAAEKALEEEKASIVELEHRVTSLTQLYDLSFELRGELLKKSVRDIEASTNAILERHFDAELRVAFTLDSDELEVSIKKSGYDCVYRQLSKGQRQLLKLAFVVSIMKASSNRAGVHFANLFFDEALDGLDSDLKVKAFSLFSDLETSHESILLIDHATEFQNLFSKRYHVTMSSDISDVSLEES